MAHASWEAALHLPGHTALSQGCSIRNLSLTFNQCRAYTSLPANGRLEFPSIGKRRQDRFPVQRLVFLHQKAWRRCQLSNMRHCHQSGQRHPSFIVCALADGGVTKSRREMLLEYVQNVQPEFMDKFIQRAPEQVVEAMRQTVSNMLGTLPAQFFEVTVTTVGENLAQLMYSVMMTGYMFRNAQYRLELSQSLEAAVALPNPDRHRRSDPQFEAGVQKSRVRGEVLRWHKTEGPRAVDAVEYMEGLEAEVEELQQQLERARQLAHGENPLLDYLKTLQPQNLQELTASAGEDALEAMNAFIQRLLGVSDAAELKMAASETTATELAKLLYWLMVVGYSIRNIEVRYDMDRVLGSAAKLAELPPGEL